MPNSKPMAPSASMIEPECREVAEEAHRCLDPDCSVFSDGICSRRSFHLLIKS
jgi:hypothetical protein